MLNHSKSRLILIFGISVNLILLGYFKYADFFIQNVNFITSSSFDLLNLTLPLAISFFTFQQIAFITDSYRQDVKEYNFINYALFVTYFPQLIAGPIVHHSEMMPQFDDKSNEKIKNENIERGLLIFSLGLIKKVIIADYFAKFANLGFDQAQSLGFIEAWTTSLSYTFQLYFDFSGYTDMAIGVALLFNIKLPFNFNSPYKALSIQDFWRRWHMTLSRFLKDYLYIPLGGNRGSGSRTYLNLFLTFLLGGLWHGASWMFVIWGALHGLALVIHRFWSRLGFKMPKALAWFITFNFANICWVFFRSVKIEDAYKVLSGMVGLTDSIGASRFLASSDLIASLSIALLITVFLNNTNEIKFSNKKWRAIPIALATVYALYLIDASELSEFLYFNF